MLSSQKTYNYLNISMDYYPYGMLMDGRHGQDESAYRYGFQGQEKDDEIKGEGNSLNYKYRMHDSRIGRFFAVDPLTAKYPHYTPYSFSGNEVIHMVELEGLEPTKSAANVEQGSVDQASDKSNNDGKIYNYTAEKQVPYAEPTWKKGSEYTGPNTAEAASMEQNIYKHNKYDGNTSNPTTKEERINDNYNAGKYTLERVDAGKDGFRAGVYSRTIDGVTFKAIVFAGTNDIYDWLTNFKQGGGMKDSQYDMATKLAYTYNAYKNLSFVGHSLGGGLASLAALVTGRSAITFNAAGLSDGTMRRYGVHNKSTSKIDAYVIRHEILNSVLKPIGQGAIGNMHLLEPTKYPKLTGKLTSPSNQANIILWRVDLHSVEQVIKSLNH